MTLSPENQAQLDAWKQASSGVRQVLLGQGNLTWQEARDVYVDGMEALLPPPAGVAFQTVDMDGVSALIATPEHRTDDRVLFYAHGGGYVHSAAGAYRGLVGHYARRLGARVYVPDYRQAPEHPFPMPIDDVFRAYRALFAMGHDPTRVALSGDSAGGELVVTVMRKARDAGVPLPVAGAALSPWADLAHTGPSAKTRDGPDPLGTANLGHPAPAQSCPHQQLESRRNTNRYTPSKRALRKPPFGSATAVVIQQLQRTSESIHRRW